MRRAPFLEQVLCLSVPLCVGNTASLAFDLIPEKNKRSSGFRLNVRFP